MDKPVTTEKELRQKIESQNKQLSLLLSDLELTESDLKLTNKDLSCAALRMESRLRMKGKILNSAVFMIRKIDSIERVPVSYPPDAAKPKQRRLSIDREYRRKKRTAFKHNYKTYPRGKVPCMSLS